MLVEVRRDPGARSRTPPRTGLDRVPPELVFLAVLIVVGGVLRFATLATQSYWADEATTVHEIGGSLGSLLHQVHVGESTPPLYYVLAWLWAKVFGTGEIGLRSLSAIAGTAVIPVTYLCGRELVSRGAGLVAAALAAVSPFMIWYSQEARAYILLALFSGLSLLFWARAWRTAARRDLVWWAVFSILAVLTHFFAGFLVAPEAALLLYRSRSRATIVAVGVVAAVHVGMLLLAISDTSHSLLRWIQSLSLSTRLQELPVDLAVRTLYESSLVRHGLLAAAVLAAACAALIVFAGGRRERRGAGLAAALAAVVVFAPIVLALIGRDYVVPRNFTPAWIPVAVAIGAACTVPRAKLAGAALATLLLVGSVWAVARIAANTAYQRKDYRAVARALGSPAGTRAIVATEGGFSAQPLAIYLDRVPWHEVPSDVITASEVDVVADSFATPLHRLPSGTRLLSSRVVGPFLVARFAVTPGWRLPLSAIGARAGSLVSEAPASPSVLVQHASS
jgi:mannosyltransferase